MVAVRCDVFARAPFAIRGRGEVDRPRPAASSCARKSEQIAFPATNAATPINSFGCSENKLDVPCQEFGRDIAALFTAEKTVKRKGFLNGPMDDRMHAISRWLKY